MRLSLLLERIGLPCLQPDTEILTVTDELEKTGRACLFVCISGRQTDGRAFAARAIARGAAAVIAESPTDVSPCYQVKNARLAFSRLCAAICGDPQNRLRLVGITGTNGKTTTARYLQSVLASAGERSAVLGTLGFSCAGETLATGYTTPKSDVFFRALQTAEKRGCGTVIAELSSQALAQYRTDAARCTLGVVTNVGRDHLDYHKNADALAAAKARLCALSSRMLLNADDGRYPFFLRANANGRSDSYGIDAPDAAFRAGTIRCSPDSVRFTVTYRDSSYPVRVPAPGRFSVYNGLAAFAAAVLLGVEPQTAARATAALPAVEGRAQMLEADGRRICVDFAHTPEALDAILQALSGGGRIITVFGCGGDRDRGKRPEMGRIAGRYSAAVVLTSDNPRTEDPMDIIEQIRRGIPAKTEVRCEPDRAKAIRLALSMAETGDTVLVAGKGHETTQTANGKTVPFSDIRTVRKLLAERGRNTGF